MGTKLSAAVAQKADQGLNDALQRAAQSDPLRVILFLQETGSAPKLPASKVSGPATSATSKSAPRNSGAVDQSAKTTVGTDRLSQRKSLIAEQRTRHQAAFGETIEAMKALTLNVSGGESTRALIAEGSAEAVARALKLPGVKHAVLDCQLSQVCETPTTNAARPSATAAAGTKKQSPAVKRRSPANSTAALGTPTTKAAATKTATKAKSRGRRGTA